MSIRNLIIFISCSNSILSFALLSKFSPRRTFTTNTFNSNFRIISNPIIQNERNEESRKFKSLSSSDDMNYTNSQVLLNQVNSKYYSTLTYKNRQSLKYLIQSIEKELSKHHRTTKESNSKLLSCLWGIQQSKTYTDRQIILFNPKTNNITLNLIKQYSPYIQERCIKFFSKIHCNDISIPLYKHMLHNNKLPSSQSYVELFMSLRIMKEYDLLEECWDEFDKSKMVIEGYYVYINALCESGFIGKKKAIDIVTNNTTSILPNSTDIQSYNIVLNSCSYNEYDRYNQNSNFDLFDSLYQHIQNKNLQFDVYTYNAILRRYSYYNNHRIIKNVIRDMKENKVRLNRFSIDLILPSLIHDDTKEYLQSLLDEYVLKNDNNSISNALEAFLVRLIVHVKQKEEDEEKIISTAFWLYDYIISKGDITPTLRHYNLLLEGHRRLLQYHANQLSLQCHDTPSSFSTMLSNVIEEECDLTKQNQIQNKLSSIRNESIHLLSNITRYYKPDEYTCTSFIDIISLSSANTTNDAEIMNQYVKYFIQEKQIPINRIVLHTLLKAYSTINRMDIAFYIFDHVRRNSLQHPSSSKYIIKNNQKIFAVSTYSYNTLFMLLSQQEDDYKFDFGNLNYFLYGSNGNTIASELHNKTILEVTYHLLNTMQSNKSTQPNTQSYCLIATIIANSNTKTKSNLAKQLYFQAINDGMKLDGRFVNAIIRCLIHEDILSIMEFWKNELSPAIRSYTGADGSTMMEELQRNNKSINNLHLLQSYHGLLYCCGYAKRPDIALRILYAMKQDGFGNNIQDILLNCYKSGKLKKIKEETSSILVVDDGKKKSRVLLPIMIKQYEDILEVECRNFSVYDKRFWGEKKIRIIF